MEQFDIKQDEDKRIEGNKLRSLLIRGWVYEGDMWSHPKHTNQGLPMLFTMEDAFKAEKL